jgi:Rrf2 family protein
VAPRLVLSFLYHQNKLKFTIRGIKIFCILLNTTKEVAFRKRMLKISKKTEYALIALLDMARNGGDTLVTARLLSKKYNIPPEILGKVLQKLAKNSLIVSQQGVNGGYKLQQPLSGITLRALIETVDGPLKLVECALHTKDNCEQEASCVIKKPMEIIQEELTGFFTGITLEVLMQKYNFNQNLITIEDLHE